MNRLHSLIQIALLGAMLALLFGHSASASDEFLSPESAFRLSASYTPEHRLLLHWDIAPGYKLYRGRVHLAAVSGGATLGSIVLPKGLRVHDDNFDQDVEIYHQKLDVAVPVELQGESALMAVSYQGCAEAGLCYPPVERRFRLTPGQSGALTALAEEGAVFQPVAQNSASVQEQPSTVHQIFASGSLWTIGFAFMIFGLLLSFTPCVLPMVPILAAIVVGEREVTRARSFTLALSYCLGMALVYTLFGIAAGLAGEGLAGALQKPWVLLLFASLLFAMSLSLFDVYQLQMPSAFQGRLNQISNRLQGGRTLSVFVMGGFSALIVGPCVAGPLAGALIYISQTHDVVLGGLALFSMAMGMSVPLLLIGLSAGRLLPRAGAWMVAVKHTFGLMLMAVALWMVQPILPAPAVLAMWGAFAILCAVFLRIFDTPPDQVSVARRFSRSLGILAFIVGIFELAGAAVGGVDVLQPLEGFKSLATGNAPTEKAVSFQRISSISQLDQVLSTTRNPVMLDFYADWCVSCKEMERFTFSNPAVASHLRGITLVQVDVTANTADDRALMKKFSLFGPPGILFFDAAGREVPNSRVIGYEQPDRFLEHLTQYLAL